jgi:acetate kinase
MSGNLSVVTVNTGSTSVKLAAFEVAASGATQRISHLQPSGDEASERNVLSGFLAQLESKPDAIAHRIVHGGTRFRQPVRLDASALQEIEQLSELAPLHNPKALKWIAAARALCEPKVVQIAAFDTSFFAGMPRVASEYALPPHLASGHGVRRYGFHGLAHEALLNRWRQMRPELPGGGRLISLQLGGGCSIAAIQDGHPVDTSMGFSPLEGLVMATRAGDVDPAIVPYLQRRLARSEAARSADEIIEFLNKDAGLAGISGLTSDLSALLEAPGSQPRFAIDLYCYRARKYIGAYLAVLGGCDGIVFGGGVGEHVPAVRAQILDTLQWAGIELDEAANQSARGAEAHISAPHSRVAVHVIPVDEEQILTAAAANLLRGP